MTSDSWYYLLAWKTGCFRVIKMLRDVNLLTLESRRWLGALQRCWAVWERVTLWAVGSALLLWPGPVIPLGWSSSHRAKHFLTPEPALGQGAGEFFWWLTCQFEHLCSVCLRICPGGCTTIQFFPHCLQFTQPFIVSRLLHLALFCLHLFHHTCLQIKFFLRYECICWKHQVCWVHRMLQCVSTGLLWGLWKAAKGRYNMQQCKYAVDWYQEMSWYP